uniref:Glucosidase II subunit alpha n=1 Tax=Parasacculina yatsui TaxID=2836420 RepID=A0A8K1RBX9_9CRUS|nr:glucosidase 2 alpha-E-like protein 2 [Parasacculina yatsui]
MFIIGLILFLASSTLQVDRSKFKTCQQSGFCRRLRAFKDSDDTIYRIDPSSINVNEDDGLVQGVINNVKDNVNLNLKITNLKGDMIRLNVNEGNPLFPRYIPLYALENEPKSSKLTVIDRQSDKLRLKLSSQLEFVIHFAPIKFELISDHKTIITVNSRRLFHFEHYRKKPDNTELGKSDSEKAANEDQEVGDVKPDDEAEEKPQEPSESDSGMWEEHFGSHEDTKPRGPSAIGADVSFPGSSHVYGIPEHADRFALEDTAEGDPYRLHNMDVFEYEVGNRMALYGSVPLVISHSASHGSAGVFWHNAAETWVDIKSLPDSGIIAKVSSFLGDSGGGGDAGTEKSVHWMSESGQWDMFLLSGPDPSDVMQQYRDLTGATSLPPLFSLGYHQCRWNYRDQRDVQTVQEQFDAHALPMDVMWLDIEHTDGKRYFTWDRHHFPEPQRMIHLLEARGRHLVTIIDPHIKRDDNYFLHSEATSHGYYVKDRHGSDFDGWCWPGSSSYLDFHQKDVRDYWASLFQREEYTSSNSVFTWNDMNEPSVFSGPEVTMPKDNLHGNGAWEHRDVHNEYGVLAPMCSARGQVDRSGGSRRSFVLTRAAFAGSQRFGAKWTGDNAAQWSHLRISLPMLLSSSVAGISFIGADVGGFFGDPDEELLVRWYQAASYQPFFRAHAHIDTKRREPYLFGNETISRIRDALQARYRLLPLWYTLFYENTITGMPPMRPMWMEFNDPDLFSAEHQYMIGDVLLVCPQTEASGSAVSVHFPVGDHIWYDIDTFTKHTAGIVSVRTPLDKVPVYQRGGTILTTWQRVRRSSAAMRSDPYTLTIALSTNHTASGSLFIDDGESFDYHEHDRFAYMRFEFGGGRLVARRALGSGVETGRWIERVVVLGLSGTPSAVRLSTEESGGPLQFTHDSSLQRTIVRKPAVDAISEWAITFEF